MIKSSDQSKKNTYRILRVLANQDYLAVDYSQTHYLFTPCQQPQVNLLSLPNNPYFLSHIQCITFEDLHYYVFKVGSKDLLWAGMLDLSLKRNPLFCFNFFKQAVSRVLYDLLWTNHREVLQYLTLTNFWVLQGQLYLLLLKRTNGRVTLKRIEPKTRHQSVPSKRSSTITIISHELQTMRLFALILWEVLHEQSWYQMKQNYDTSSFVSRTLALMITRSIPYEQIQQAIAEQEQKITNSKTRQLRITHKPKRKSNTISVVSQVEERRCLTSPKLTYSSTQPVQNTTKSILRPVILFNRPKRSDRLLAGSRKLTTVSVKSEESSQNRSLDKTHRRKSVQSRQPFSEAVRYSAWKHRTISVLEEKINKQSQQARQKFQNNLETINNEGRVSQVTQDEILKSRLVAKMQKYKKQKEQQREARERSNTKVPLINQPSILDELNKASEHQHLDLPVESANKPSASIQQAKVVQVQIPKIINTQSLKTEPEQKGDQNDKKQVLFNKSQARRPIKPTKLFQNQSQDNSEIEEISFNRQSTVYEPPKVQQKDNEMPKKLLMAYRQLQIPKIDPPSAFQSLEKSMTVGSMTQQFLTMLNILGDITVKAIRTKLELESVSWKKIIFFLYQRFFSERNRWLVHLEQDTPMPTRGNQQMQPVQWRKWHSSPQKIAMLKAIRSQNPVIRDTLTRLATRVLEDGGLQKKVEYFVRNREELQAKLNGNMRRQISKIVIIYLINDFDSLSERKETSTPVLAFIRDCLFGARIVAELDGLLPVDKKVELSRYREEPATIESMAKSVDIIYDLYFPESPQKAL